MTDDRPADHDPDADPEADAPAPEHEAGPGTSGTETGPEASETGDPPSGDAPSGEATEAADGAGGDADGGGSDPSEKLSEEIREELKELEELRDRHLRLAAEFENYRKRTRREKGEIRERSQAALAERLLDALDDLERFLEAPSDAADAGSLREGVEMVRDKLWKELSEAGLQRMEPEGSAFDPERHEALLTSPTEEPEADGTVSRVLLNGYTFGDRVLRPARVEVRKHARPDGGGGAGGDGDGTDED